MVRLGIIIAIVLYGKDRYALPVGAETNTACRLAYSYLLHRVYSSRLRYLYPFQSCLLTEKAS